MTSQWTPEAIRALGATTDLPTLGSIFGLSPGGRARWRTPGNGSRPASASSRSATGTASLSRPSWTFSPTAARPQQTAPSSSHPARRRSGAGHELPARDGQLRYGLRRRAAALDPRRSRKQRAGSLDSTLCHGQESRQLAGPGARYRVPVQSILDVLARAGAPGPLHASKPSDRAQALGTAATGIVLEPSVQPRSPAAMTLTQAPPSGTRWMHRYPATASSARQLGIGKPATSETVPMSIPHRSPGSAAQEAATTRRTEVSGSGRLAAAIPRNRR